MNWKKVFFAMMIALCIGALIVNAVWVPLPMIIVRIIGVVMLIVLVLIYREPKGWK